MCATRRREKFAALQSVLMDKFLLQTLVLRSQMFGLAMEKILIKMSHALTMTNPALIPAISALVITGAQMIGVLWMASASTGMDITRVEQSASRNMFPAMASVHSNMIKQHL